MSRSHFIGQLALPVSLTLLFGCGPGTVSLDCAPAAVADPSTPIQYGQREVDKALTEAGLKQKACLFTVQDRGVLATFNAAGALLGTGAESFAAIGTPHGIAILGRDAAGAMYGALEVAERIRMLGEKALPPELHLAGSPLIHVRGANLFLTLPGPQEESWWFHSSAFWTEYLDLLARGRFNFLDLHGMYDPDNTLFPNALLYFATSRTYPQLGAPPEDRQRNLIMLNTVIRMAAARGIRVGLMSYRADLSLTGSSPPQQHLPDAELKTYTREAAADFARSVPALWRFGFRIGESGRPASWYHDTFVAGARQANPAVELYTRTWLSNKSDVLATAQAAGGHFMVEAKFNGEHLALPYPIAGGVFTDRWQHYSYEEYLNHPAPWLFVFQIRAGGTHRIFRQASLPQIRRLMRAVADTHASGFSYEFPHAYTPQRDFYHAARDAYSEWTFRRDELQYLMAGRLAYDVNVPEAVFRAALERRVGTDALWEPLQAASEIVPWIQAAHTCGPDHRDAAPELELGGPVGYWAQPTTAIPPAGTCRLHYHGAFDSFAIASPHEDAAELVSGSGGTRLSPRVIAQRMLQNAGDSRRAVSVPIDPDNAEARDLQRECAALADLGEFFAHKLRAATALAVYAQSGRADYLSAARAESAQSGDAFRTLANDTAYIAPFVEELRMSWLGLRPFHWSAETPRLAEEEPSIDAIASAVAAAPPRAHVSPPPAASWLNERRSLGPGLKQIRIEPAEPLTRAWFATAILTNDAPPGSSVRILWKHFANIGGWTAVPAHGSGRSWSAIIQGGRGGALFAVEVVRPGQDGWRYPDVLAQTPYVTLAPAGN